MRALVDANFHLPTITKPKAGLRFTDGKAIMADERRDNDGRCSIAPGDKTAFSDMRKGLMKLATLASKASSLSEAIFDYWSTELPKRHPEYPVVNPGEDSGPPPPQEKKLRELLKSLPEDMLWKLALVMDLGIGRFDTRDLPGGYQALRDNFDRPSELIALMIDTPLESYLTRGMAKLKNQGIDLDKMDFTPAKAGK